MKKYRLLKDMPGANANTVFVKVPAGHYQPLDDKDCYFPRLTVGSVESNPEWFEEVVERWKPRDEDFFSHISIDSTGPSVRIAVWQNNNQWCHEMFAAGNVFKRSHAEEAKRRIEKVLADYHKEINE